jgi:catechol 2,3-dioxygenase-like lactoylglutathione lyase family enzyme
LYVIAGAALTARAEEGLNMTGTSHPIDQADPDTPSVGVESLSAVTLATHDMARSVHFYRALGFELRYGGEDAPFTSFNVGNSYLNIVAVSEDQAWTWWGRVIFHVSDVDAMYTRATRHGLKPQFAPRDASWGERFFHLSDPDGHELSFARPLSHPPE